MAYNRTPNTVLAGRGLKQSPSQTGSNPVGVVTVTVDADIASNTTLGVIRVGSGLNIDANGVLSTIVTPGGVSVKLVSEDYDILPMDYYVGVIRHVDKNNSITLTLPIGTIGKFYIIKNQSAGGNVKVIGTSGETIDTSTSKNLGNEASIMVIFDGTRWNIVQ